MPGDDGSPPPPPDYGPVASASEKSAELSYQLGQDQLAWAKDQFAQNKEVSDKVVNSALDTLNANNEAAKKDRARYEETYQPLEDSLVKDAQDYANPAKRQYDMGRAGATVSQNFDQARSAALQSLEGFGVDPSSTRFAALDIGQRASKAAAVAAAENQQGEVTDATGRALRSEAINVGRGYPGQVATTYGTALQSGNQAVNTGLATTASGANTMGTATQWQGLGNQAVQNWGNTLHQGYQDQLGAYQASQSGGGSGVGSILGAVAPMAMMAMGMATGGAVPDPDEMTTGGTVPVGASPSGGQAIDDVPARLTPGEMVMPKDVVQWKGEEYFQKLIEQARKAKPQAPAQPQMRPVTPAPTTFASRPVSRAPRPTGQGGAIPV